MAKQIAKIMFFLFVLLAPLITVNEIYINSSHYRSMNGLYKFENIPENIEIANLGTSHGRYGITYEQIKDRNCFNFAIDSQPLYYDYQIFNTYIDHFAEDSVLIIPISIFSLYNSLNSFEENEPIYYRLLDKTCIYNCSLKKLILFKYIPVLNAKENLTIAMKKQRTPPTYSVPERTRTTAEFVEHGNAVAASHIKLSKDQKIDKLNVDALYNILKLCKEKSITPVIITTPATKYYTDNIPEEFTTLFYEDIQNIVGSDILYLKYLYDPRFNSSTNLFCDSDHLNQAGRDKFSAILFNDLQRLGVLQQTEQ